MAGFTPTPTDIKIPVEQSARIRAIQDVHFDALDDALDTVDDQIAAQAKKSMAKIRASNFSDSVIRAETRKITGNTTDVTREALANQVRGAAEYAQRAADTIRAWQVSGRLRTGVDHLTVSDSAFARASRPGAAAVDAEAALARITHARLRTPAEQRAALERYGSKLPRIDHSGPATDGTRAMNKLRKAGIVKKSSEIGLSERLHGAAANNIKATERSVGIAIREGKNINRAGRDLIRHLNSDGTQLSVKRKLTKPLQRLRRASRRLQRLSLNTSDPDALKAATKEFNKEFAKIKKITASRVDARGGFLELQQTLTPNRESFRALKVKKRDFVRATEKQIDAWVTQEQTRRMDKALTRWLDEKQAFHSERIIETETSGAYRAREYQQHANKPYVVGFWWRRNPGMSSLDKKRKKDIRRVRRKARLFGGRKTNAKRKTKGAPCRICPSLADRRFPVEYAREWPRGAHPMCRCWYEWIYDQGELAKTPVTQGDLDWYDSLPG